MIFLPDVQVIIFSVMVSAALCIPVYEEHKEYAYEHHVSKLLELFTFTIQKVNSLQPETKNEYNVNNIQQS